MPCGKTETLPALLLPGAHRTVGLANQIEAGENVCPLRGVLRGEG